jgi:hypothetical protein
MVLHIQRPLKISKQKANKDMQLKVFKHEKLQIPEFTKKCTKWGINTCRYVVWSPKAAVQVNHSQWCSSFSCPLGCPAVGCPGSRAGWVLKSWDRGVLETHRKHTRQPA